MIFPDSASNRARGASEGRAPRARRAAEPAGPQTTQCALRQGDRAAGAEEEGGEAQEENTQLV